MKVTLCLATLLLLSQLTMGSYAAAQSGGLEDIPKSTGWGSELGLIKHSTLNVSDQVTDNCWTNSASIRSRVYLTFETNEIFVPDYRPKFYNFETVITTLSAFGFRTSNGICAISATFDVKTPVTLTLGGFEGKSRYNFNYAASIFESSSIFTNNGNVNAQISDFFEGAASEFVAKIVSARRSPEFLEYRREYPSTRERPMSVEEWETMMEEWVDKQSD